MVISCLVNIVQGGGGGKFYLGLGCSKIRQKRSSVSLLLKPIVVFLLDGSASVPEDDFQMGLRFTSELLEALAVSLR